MLFLWIALISMSALAALNIFLSTGFFAVLPVSPGAAVVWSFLAVAFAVAVDALVALFICRATPSKWYSHKYAIYRVSAKEKKFYEKLKIRKWKDKMPEWGKLTGFSKNQIARPRDNEYLDKYFLELCYGEVIHFLSVPASLFVFWFVPSAMSLSLALPVTIVNILCNLPSLFILRYNSYKLEVLYKNNEKRRAAREFSSAVCPDAAECACSAD